MTRLGYGTLKDENSKQLLNMSEFLLKFMPNLIVYEERKVKAKGLNSENKVNEEKLKEYFFEEDYQRLSLLDNLPKITLNTSSITLLYPGCGVDLFTPLIYLDKLFLQVTEAKLIFVDENQDLGLLKTLLDEVGVSFEEKKNILRFYWEEKLISLEFQEGEISQLLPEFPPFNLYFEKAFRIMREHIPDYEKDILNKLSVGGVIISDTGFENADLESFNAPKELSTYGEMIIGRKKK